MKTPGWWNAEPCETQQMVALFADEVMRDVVQVTQGVATFYVDLADEDALRRKNGWGAKPRVVSPVLVLE